MADHRDHPHKYRWERLHEEALERARQRGNRTAEEQLARLDGLLGRGQGAQKERARLKRQIEERKTRSPGKKEA